MQIEKLATRQIEIRKIGPCIVRLWNPEDGPKIYDQLEQHDWPPWLAAKQEILSERAKVFPDGQLLIQKTESNLILATLSTNRFNWDGNPHNLSSWDKVAGKPPDFSKTYKPKGNTLDFVSMNVHPEYQGSGLAKLMIELIKEQAKKLGITYLIGDFRPNQFGEFKLIENNWQVDFETYCNMKRDDGWPIDSWLRNLVINGMMPLIIDRNAMTVPVNLAEFEHYKTTYHPERWKQVAPDLWECGEVGQLTIKGNQAIYQESNYWGQIPL